MYLFFFEKMDNNEANRHWAENYMDLIHQYIWEYKNSINPPIQYSLPDSKTKDDQGNIFSLFIQIYHSSLYFYLFL